MVSPASTHGLSQSVHSVVCSDCSTPRSFSVCRNEHTSHLLQLSALRLSVLLLVSPLLKTATGLANSNDPTHTRSSRSLRSSLQRHTTRLELEKVGQLSLCEGKRASEVFRQVLSLVDLCNQSLVDSLLVGRLVRWEGLLLLLLSVFEELGLLARAALLAVLGKVGIVDLFVNLRVRASVSTLLIRGSTLCVERTLTETEEMSTLVEVAIT